jgi:acyl-coenzyme A thioesterase PaaI-like protein
MALLRETAYLRAFGMFKIPMIFFLSPTVLELSEKRSVVKIPLTFRSKNHLGSMYFGALCTGADCAGGLLAVKHIRESGRNVSFVFKDFKAEFLKRPECDVHFVCDDGKKAAALVKKVIETGERHHTPLHIEARSPDDPEGAEPFARFTLNLSLKRL